MASRTRRRRKPASIEAKPVDTYQAVTDKIVAALDKGVVPWHRPWRTVAGHAPTSLATGKPYRGINVMTLGMESLLHGYESPYWMTFRQAKLRGGHVRKGEKSSAVYYWKRFVKPDPDNPHDEDAKRTFMMLLTFLVFNADQTEDVQGVPVVEELPEFQPIETCEQIVAEMPKRPELRHSLQDRAYYSPILDFVHLPPGSTFDTPETYYGTMFHELVHATGHASRIGRPGIELVDRFGSEKYSKEELIAEIGAAFLCGDAGIDVPIDNSAAYIQSWMRVLQNDKRLIPQAASQAHKAVDYILGREEEADAQDS